MGRHRIDPPPSETPTRIENRLPGSDSFALKNPARNREVEGYASTTSASVGDTVAIAVNVSRPQGVRWDLYRIGYYQGLGARLVGSGEAVSVVPQPEPSISASTGLVECSWATSITLTVEASWSSGYYLIKLSTDDGFEYHVPLVIRESGRTAPLLMQANVTRWQAYNLWGGTNLYVNHLPDPRAFNGPRGYQVSFDRPYGVDGDVSMRIEHSMVRWLEREGYDVAYVTNVDIDSNPELLQGRLLYMTAGHDEYWSLGERNALEDARDQGLSMAFFSGNTAYRRIRFDPSTAGDVPRRVITCYKDASLDPVGGAPDNTADYHMAPHARAENGMLGVLWAGWGNLEGFPFVVKQPEHWVYEGTGVEAGDSLGSIVGYEWDMVSHNSVSPPDLEVIAASPALHEYGYMSQHHSTVFYPTASSFVFAAGTIGWAKGLSEEGIENPRVQRATQNILSRAGLFPEARVEESSAPTSYQLHIATSSRVIAGAASRGREDGPGSKARFSSPSGIAVGPAGELYVCDTGNDLLRKISPDGHVSTVLGKAANGDIRLNTPTGIAVDANGNVYISDTSSSRIIFLSADGSSVVFSGHAAGYVDDPDRGIARFHLQRGLGIDANGILYVADLRNDAIRRIDPSTGEVSTIINSAGGPTAVAVAPDGTLYYVATWLGAIIRASPTGERTTLANAKHTYGDRVGPGAQAALRPADGLLLTPDGVVFTDTANNRVRFVEFREPHDVITLFGTGRAGNAESELNLPRAIAAVADGYVVADTANHRILHFSNAPLAGITR